MPDDHYLDDVAVISQPDLAKSSYRMALVELIGAGARDGELCLRVILPGGAEFVVDQPAALSIAVDLQAMVLQARQRE
ncbi:MAG: hypothetical protein KF774_02395 [Planctomyces sp.]|nr:hypothetical protein [Planctomyces sp.]